MKLMKITIKLLIAIFLLLALKVNANSDPVDNIKQIFTYIDKKTGHRLKI